MSFLQKSPAYQRFMENYYESDDPLYNGLRAVGSRLGRLFDENEQAKVIRAIRETDPHFKMDRFQTELKEYIVPEVIDAFLSADRADMRAWMSEAAFNVSWAVLGEYIKSGLVSASQVIEVSSVDVLQAKFHNETVPVFLVTCESQEVHAWKSAKTGEVKVGDARSVKRSRYVFALTMVESELENELTSGWKVVEVGCGGYENRALLMTVRTTGDVGRAWSIYYVCQTIRRGAFISPSCIHASPPFARAERANGDRILMSRHLPALAQGSRLLHGLQLASYSLPLTHVPHVWSSGAPALSPNLRRQSDTDFREARRALPHHVSAMM